MRALIFLVLALSISLRTVYAQSGWNWPEDKATAQEKNVLYSDALKFKKYEDAVEPLEWLLANAPDLNQSIYINGVKIYQNLAEKATDDDKKKEYQEKTLSMYDLRVQYFNNEGKVTDRKAYTAYKFYKNDKSKYKELFDLYEKNYEINREKVGTNNLVAYMDVMRRYKLSGGELTDEDVLDRYKKVMDIIDKKIANGEPREKMIKNKEFVDKMLTSMVTVDCKFIENNLGPKLIDDDLGMAKKIIALSLAASCSDTDAFLRAAKVVQKIEPDFGLAKVLGIRYCASGNFEEGMQYFSQAAELADTDEKKAEVTYEMALQYTKQGQRSNARSYALKAVSLDPSLKKSYKLIGDLYYNSYNDCRKEESKVEDRAVYLAAYDMYEKAGNTQMMEASRKQFPSIEEMFELNLQEGQSFSVGCWINTETTLRRRPE